MSYVIARASRARACACACACASASASARECASEGRGMNGREISRTKARMRRRA